MDFNLFLLEVTRFWKALLIGPGWALIFLMLGWGAARYGLKSWQKRFWTAALVYPLLCTMPPLREVLSWALVQATPQAQPLQAGAIVVLGSGVSPEGVPSTASAERAQKAAQLWKAGYAPLVLVSGGYTVTGPRTEAESMAIILTGLGVPPKAVILESNSLNTFDNAVESRKLLAKRNIGQILLVTSRIHLLRSTLIFRKQGMQVTPIPAEQKPFQPDWNFGPTWERAQLLQATLNEYFGLLGYWLQGKL
ncbi:MAG: YdcF family protein [Gloeobacterales cyanobacterium]